MSIENEQLALVVFFLGFFLNVGIIAGSLEKIGALIFYFLLSLVFIWFFSGPEEDSYDIFGMTMILFIGLMLYTLYDRLLPRIYTSGLLIYSALFFYVVWNLFEGHRAPDWFWIPPGLPIAVTLLVYVTGTTRPPAFVRGFLYLWYLVTGACFMAAQFQVDYLKALYDAGGWSLSVYVYVFVTGMVLVNLLAYLFFIMLHLPFGPRRSRHAKGPDLDDEIREHMRDHYVADRPGLANIILVVLFLMAAVYNTASETIPHLLFLDVCLILVAPLYQYLFIKVKEPGTTDLVDNKPGPGSEESQGR